MIFLKEGASLMDSQKHLKDTSQDYGETVFSKILEEIRIA